MCWTRAPTPTPAPETSCSATPRSSSSTSARSPRRSNRLDGQPFDELDRELRARVGAELRADAEEAERDAAMAARRGRSLTDVLREVMWSGREVVVEVAGQRFAGSVTAVGDDLARVRTPSGDIDIVVSAVTAVHVSQQSGPPGGRDGTVALSSLKARLREHELSGDTVVVGLRPDGRPRTGVIVAVAVDHVLFRDRDGAGEEAAVPLAAVAYVRSRVDPR